MGGVFGFLLQGFNDHCLDLVVGDLPWSTGPRVVGQPVHPILDEAPAPLADHRLAHSERFGHLPVGRASIGATHDDARSHGHCLRALAPVGQAFERLALLGAEHQLGLRPSSVSHSCLPSWLMMRGTRSGTGNSRNRDISSELRGRDTRAHRGNYGGGVTVVGNLEAISRRQSSGGAFGPLLRAWLCVARTWSCHRSPGAGHRPTQLSSYRPVGSAHCTCWSVEPSAASAVPVSRYPVHPSIGAAPSDA